MKQLIILLLAIAPGAAYAQSASKPAKTSTTASALNTALCDCFSKDKNLRFESQEAIGVMMGKCMEESEKTQRLFISYIKEKGVAPDDNAGMREAGREMGKAVTQSCPVLYKAVLELMSREQADSVKGK